MINTYIELVGVEKLIIVHHAVQNWIGVIMSRYGEYRGGYDRENLFDEMKRFLGSYPLSELMKVLTDVIETVEWEKAEDE